MMHSRTSFGCAAALLLAAAAPLAMGQSLMRQPTQETPVDEAGNPDTQAPLRGLSLTLVEKPKPKTIAVHDKVTIAISETSKSSSEQKLDTKKDTSLKGSVNAFPDLSKLLEGELINGNSNPSVDLSGKNSFKGDAKFERSDRFTDRITATVIDVKPNGVIVLEARRTITSGKETQLIVLSGECRREDITSNNTVLSSQLAELTIVTTNDGDVKDGASKGVLTRLFEAIFNF